MESKRFKEVGKIMVAEYTNTKAKTEGYPPIKPEEVYVVWYSKTLQNHKALMSTPVPDGMYYELTYNGDKDELYFDAYEKKENACISHVSRTHG